MWTHMLHAIACWLHSELNDSYMKSTVSSPMMYAPNLLLEYVLWVLVASTNPVYVDKTDMVHIRRCMVRNSTYQYKPVHACLCQMYRIPCSPDFDMIQNLRFKWQLRQQVDISLASVWAESLPLWDAIENLPGMLLLLILNRLLAGLSWAGAGETS